MGSILLMSDHDDLSSRFGLALRERTGMEIQIMPVLPDPADAGHLPDSPIMIVDLESIPASYELYFEGLNRVRPDTHILAIRPRDGQHTLESALHNTVDEIVDRPVTADQVARTVEHVLGRVIVLHRVMAVQARLRKEMGQSQIIARSRKMREIMQRLPQLAESNSTVLITGETGTGKELVARAIHYLGPRAAKPFVTIDCGAIPEHLVENELFGHARGAYTDAGQASNGLLHEAEGGTLFLDEVEALQLAVQSKLMRFLQERQYKPLGQSSYVRVDARVLAATNVDLLGQVHANQFRSDLYYRLNVVPLFIPPLRERKTDIAPLVSFFLQRYADEEKAAPKIPPETLRAWMEYQWPGNVRELENKVQELVTSPSPAGGLDEQTVADRGSKSVGTLSELRKSVLSQHEQQYLDKLLISTRGNVSAAARVAGIDRKNLGLLLKKYCLDPVAYRR
jgi:two-component system, NtrC family, response regulator GlrR